MTQTVSVGEFLNISNSTQHCQEWRELLNSDVTEIGMDISGLRDVDTSGVQLLLAFKRDLATRGKRLSFSGETSILQNKAQLLGLASALLDS